MESLEQEFTARWTACCEEMQRLGIPARRMLSAIGAQGALPAARRILGGRRCSDGFDALAARELLSLSLEALAAGKRFGPLFTDAEVNEALARLLEAGYFRLSE